MPRYPPTPSSPLLHPSSQPVSVSTSARRRRAVLPASYMIVFLLMTHRMAPVRMGFGGIESGCCNGKKGLARGLRSELRTCAWTADEDSGGRVQEMGKEYDPLSVADWHAGMDY
ncbi:hypothetical protein CVT25_008858 [Psilocybe cyanescens]|uniref:Uncharacterized protein n=1 Tax=Psilocybe cyanescens TaxID=93625 RepID=A0A409XAH7_PSICY|nr:hypothetical protein CVT25_008858 [Psilocybe cyanescens]